MEIDKNEIQSIIDIKIKDGVKKFGKDFKFIVLEIISLEKMLTPEPTETKHPKLIPLVKWNEHFPDPSVKALRMLVFRKETNGFDKVIVKRGNRILLDVDEYFKWAGKNAAES